MSHRLQQLEGHLGVRLVNRTTRRLQLTEQGHAFFENATQVIEALERAESAVADSGGRPRGTIRVTAPLGLGRRTLAPLSLKFMDAHPDISIRLRLSDHILDLLAEAVDIALRLAVLPDSSLIGRKIADVPRVLCAAPSYLAQHGTPKQPEDLFGHNCLLLRFPGSQQYRWTLQSLDGPIILSIQGRMDADDGDVLADWARAGHGITMRALFEVGEDLRAGRLVRVLPDFPPVPTTLSVVYPHKRLLPARVKLFADFLVREVTPMIATAHEEFDLLAPTPIQGTTKAKASPAPA
jgi:DNA-binding transcriptional LysR family regulator